MGKNFHHAQVKKRIERSKTKKILNKLLRSQTSAKRNFRLKSKLTSTNIIQPQEEHESLKFGSINIDGIDIQKHWAVKELIRKRGFDVSSIDRPKKERVYTDMKGSPQIIASH